MENNLNLRPDDQEQNDGINQHKLLLFQEELREKQNLPMAIGLGGLAAILGAGIWAAITVATGYQLGLMAVGLGLLVGFAVRFAGNGIDQIFGYVGAMLVLLGCLTSNVLIVYGSLAQLLEVGIFEAISVFPLAEIPSLVIETFNPIHLLFYGLAIYLGYRSSFRPITEKEIVENAVDLA